MNSRKWILVFSVVLLLAGGTAIYMFAVRERVAPPPVPELTGKWVQAGADPSSDWYFIAEITDELIEVWKYRPSNGEQVLYWTGTFTPPPEGATGDYTWESINDIAKAKTSMFASREEKKSFTYSKDGRISFITTASLLQMGYSLERPGASK
ncbi:MAG: hypothetical protein J5449_02075 [Oscillospiraceae bacterium]|nr:hypothetical protein [Oscillospiraceae bacterium]